MKAQGQSRAASKGFFLLAAVLFTANPEWAQSTNSEIGHRQTSELEAPAGLQREVLVSLPDRKLAVLEDGKVVKIFDVAVGANVNPSPIGEFHIINRVPHPAYYHGGAVMPPGKSNPVGSAWVGLNKRGYGIHGTNEPDSIGKAASHGCIRLRNKDIDQFLPMVSVGDTVKIRGERDPYTKKIFSGEENSSSSVEARAAKTLESGGQ